MIVALLFPKIIIQKALWATFGHFDHNRDMVLAARPDTIRHAASGNSPGEYRLR